MATTEGAPLARWAARLVAQLATLIFGNAYEQWVDAHGSLSMATCVSAASGSLREAIAEITKNTHFPSV